MRFIAYPNFDSDFLYYDFCPWKKTYDSMAKVAIKKGPLELIDPYNDFKNLYIKARPMNDVPFSRDPFINETAVILEASKYEEKENIYHLLDGIEVIDWLRIEELPVRWITGNYSHDFFYNFLFLENKLNCPSKFDELRDFVLSDYTFKNHYLYSYIISTGDYSPELEQKIIEVYGKNPSSLIRTIAKIGKYFDSSLIDYVIKNGHAIDKIEWVKTFGNVKGMQKGLTGFWLYCFKRETKDYSVLDSCLSISGEG